MVTVSVSQKPDSPASYDHMELLIKAGADVNAHDKKGQTVLHEVARDWDDDIAGFLINKVCTVKCNMYCQDSNVTCTAKCNLYCQV